MQDHSDIEDVEQSETNDDDVTSLTAEPPETLEEAGFEGFGIGDADTAEGQARRAEEAHLEEVDSDKADGWDVPSEDDLEELPTAEEAELGELCRVPEVDLTAEPPTFEDLFDQDSFELIEALEGPVEATDEEVRTAIEDSEDSILEDIESEFEDFGGGL